MEEDTSLSAGFVFRGVGYYVTVGVHDALLTVEVEDRATSDQWRNTFDSQYIEDLTHKTGNYKRFSVFVSMLESAINQDSETVSLDLLTFADLEAKQKKKSGSGTKSIPGARSTAVLNSKRYLILTYSVEFDRVEYPLTLPYVGKPDPRILQDTVRQLRHDIKLLKQQGGRDYRLKETETLRRDYDRLVKEKAAIESAFNDYKREVEVTTEGVAVKEVRVLKSMVQTLEEELMTLRNKHQRSTTKRSQQYRQLVDELEEAKANERNLRVRVKSLTNELAQYKRSGSRAFPSSSFTSRNSSRASVRNTSTGSKHASPAGSRHNSYSRDSSTCSRGSRDGSKTRFTDTTGRNRSASRDRVTPRERSLSRERSGRNSSRERLLNSGSYRMRTPSPAGARSPRFDPTAYKLEKDRRRNETQLKLKRQTKSKMSGADKPQSKPSGNWSDTDFNGLQRFPLRSSSVCSAASVTSSIESLSDIVMRSDNSDSKRSKGDASNKRNSLSKPPKTIQLNGLNTKFNEKKPKILSSTPEHARVRRKIQNKENVNFDGNSYLEQSAELSDIDARLARLQKFMKDNLQ